MCAGTRTRLHMCVHVGDLCTRQGSFPSPGHPPEMLPGLQRMLQRHKPWKYLQSSWVSQESLICFISSTQRLMAGGRGEGARGSLTPLRAECLGLGRIQTYYKPLELLISWISVMS